MGRTQTSSSGWAAARLGVGPVLRAARNPCLSLKHDRVADFAPVFEKETFQNAEGASSGTALLIEAALSNALSNMQSINVPACATFSGRRQGLCSGRLAEKCERGHRRQHPKT
jgi:hypothetical protein